MIITSKKVITFYNNHPHYNIDDMNEIFIDLITNVLSQTPNQNVNENQITVLLKNISQKCGTINSTINDVHTSQTQIQSNLSDLKKVFWTRFNCNFMIAVINT